MAEAKRPSSATSTDAALVERAGRDQGGAVQPPLPARHRPARQPRAGSASCAREVARINTELRAARDRGRRSRRRPRERGDGVMADDATATPTATPARSARASSSPTAWTRPPSWPSPTACATPATTRPCSAPSKLYVHDEANDLNVGDRVRVHGDPPAVQAQALARSSKCWSGPDDPAGDPPPGRRQQRRQGGARASRCSAAPAAATPRSATSSSPPSRTPSPAPP